MIVVRNVFQLKFGKAKDALSLAKENSAMMKKAGMEPMRALTDVTGDFYTLVLEGQFGSLAEMESRMKEVQSNPEWSQWYQKFTPLVESGHREIMKVVE